MALFAFFTADASIADTGKTQETKSSVRNIDAIDPSPVKNPWGAYYPGFRGANQLIIYTPEYGERTGTNEFGLEAIVKELIVQDMNGSDSLIPKDGFVISGHGKAKTWIEKNIIPGAYIKYDNAAMELTSGIEPESYIFWAERNLKKVWEVINYYKETDQFYDYTESSRLIADAQEDIDNAKIYIKQHEIEKSLHLAKSALDLTNKALNFALPAKEGEFHGIWIRPTEKKSDDIEKTVQKIKSAGIENIFLETYYHGYTIFPSSTLENYKVQSQRQEFQGFDALASWIEQAHKEGLKVHVWFQTFYVGNDDLSKNPKHVLSVYPKWGNKQRRSYNVDAPSQSASEHNGYFLDPANEEVQTYLKNIIAEIVAKYDIDGINIDYIRYPASIRPDFPGFLQSTWGYTDYARNEFQSLYGADPAEITPSMFDLWNKWVQYRQNKVTEFVKNLKNIVKDKPIILSVVIFPNLTEGNTVKLQNWQDWGYNKYVDAFTPLIIGTDREIADTYVKGIINNSDESVKVYAGLFEPFVSAPSSDMLYQIISARNAKADGIVLFDYAHLSDEYIKSLNSRIFIKP